MRGTIGLFGHILLQNVAMVSEACQARSRHGETKDASSVIPAKNVAIDVLDPDADLFADWARGKSPDTILNFRSTLNLLRAFLKIPASRDPVATIAALGQGPANHLVLKWTHWLEERGTQPQSIRQYLSRLKSAMKLLFMMGRTTVILGVKGPKPEPRSTIREHDNFQQLDAEHKATVIELEEGASAEEATWLQVRDATMIRLARHLGLRRIELQRLDLSDYDRDRGRLLVLGKGRKKKEPHPLAAKTVKLLDRWVKHHPSGSGPMPSTKGGRLTRNGISKLFTRREAGPTHDKRRLAITSVLMQTDLTKARHFARHASIQTTALYDIRGAEDLEDLAETAVAEE
jgi:integrase